MKIAGPLGLVLCSVFGILTLPAAYADGPPAPPEEAFTACQSKSAGDACTAPMRDHTEAGTCTAFPADGRLFCRPSAHHGPPPQAFDACSGKSESDACSVTFGDHTMQGTCKSGPDGRLACAPSGGPGPGPSSTGTSSPAPSR
jgi:hypothetical protein